MWCDSRCGPRLVLPVGGGEMGGDPGLVEEGQFFRKEIVAGDGAGELNGIADTACAGGESGDDGDFTRVPFTRGQVGEEFDGAGGVAEAFGGEGGDEPGVGVVGGFVEPARGIMGDEFDAFSGEQMEVGGAAGEVGAEGIVAGSRIDECGDGAGGDVGAAGGGDVIEDGGGCAGAEEEGLGEGFGGDNGQVVVEGDVAGGFHAGGAAIGLGGFDGGAQPVAGALAVGGGRTKFHQGADGPLGGDGDGGGFGGGERGGFLVAAAGDQGVHAGGEEGFACECLGAADEVDDEAVLVLCFEAGGDGGLALEGALWIEGGKGFAQGGASRCRGRREEGCHAAEFLFHLGRGAKPEPLG